MNIEKTIFKFLETQKISVTISSLFFRHLHSEIKIDNILKEKFKGAKFYCYYASDWRGTLSHKKYLIEPNNQDQQPSVCSKPFTDLIIGWDGKVKSCSIDYNSEYSFGNLNNQSLTDIWYGQRRMKFLESVKMLEYDRLSVCKNCNSPYHETKKIRKTG